MGYSTIRSLRISQLATLFGSAAHSPVHLLGAICRAFNLDPEPLIRWVDNIYIERWIRTQLALSKRGRNVTLRKSLVVGTARNANLCKPPGGWKLVARWLSVADEEISAQQGWNREPPDKPNITSPPPPEDYHRFRLSPKFTWISDMVRYIICLDISENEVQIVGCTPWVQGKEPPLLPMFSSIWTKLATAALASVFFRKTSKNQHHTYKSKFFMMSSSVIQWETVTMVTTVTTVTTVTMGNGSASIWSFAMAENLILISALSLHASSFIVAY
ncbi:unnamed protein product [Nesidiocoris tenuis]|uniref:Uncharacterized protein n=1 Tax=Nesidiocoris tenuis TaxID=355587 RepID=A0A6H5H4C7_9HEMI|nr:unnamed protein product [Nesidiocoris tenuis]